MSKSKNNFITIKSILEKYHPMTLRFLFLQSGYRKPINITEQSLIAAEKGYLNLIKSISANEEYSTELNQGIIDRFESAMSNDLNTSKALSIILKNKHKSTTIYLMKILGLLN